VTSFRGAWSTAGLVAGAAGLATSYFAAMALTIRESPVVAVAELIIRLTPGPVAEYLISLVGRLDKPLLLVGIVLVLGGVFAWTGRLARHTWWAPALVYGVLSGIGAVAVAAQRGAAAVDQLPVAVGFVTWLVTLSLLTEPLRAAEALVEAAGVSATDVELAPIGAHTRRTFGIRVGMVVAAAGVLGVVGRVVGRGRRHVEEVRNLLRLPQVTRPAVPEGASLRVSGISRWATPSDSFYRIDTAFVVPAIEPKDWSLRIHGMVEREITLTYADLLERQFTEAWVTLNCVSNEVGGDLIGNAWWSGVRLAPLLAEAGPLPGADAVLQTSDDGWTCGTPLAALTDDRNAMLAVAMNGRPLPLDHGFPVRTLVPGLYGYVSATKWVVEMEVSTFADITAYWTERGWGELGPVKMSSRVDVPRSGDEVAAGKVRFGGVAWSQHTGISAVQFAVDGGDWQEAELGLVPSDDTWVQWSGTAEVEPGDHLVTVRAVDSAGTAQISVEQDVLPDGATGLHQRDFTAS
jgi:DMSO/TMAO reductase YedYZ molybdopterin-dependent catalytic subunit